MRELERHTADSKAPGSPGIETASAIRTLAVVGRGRLGRALTAALREGGLEVAGPLGRGERPAGADAVLLCVPDAEIERAATVVAGTAPLVGHTSGAAPLAVLGPATEAGAETFSLHPLQTLTGEEPAELAAARLSGAACAVAGSTPGALAAAHGLAARLGAVALEIEEAGRPAYHAAASIASNYLVTLEDAAEALAEGAGLDRGQARRALAPLVRATVENWASLGPEDALTGPAARGDEATIAAQRRAVASVDEDLLPLFDTLLERTRALAARGAPEPLAAGGLS